LAALRPARLKIERILAGDHPSNRQIRRREVEERYTRASTLKGPRRAGEIERLDRRAYKLVALSLFALAAYVAFEAGKAPIIAERPSSTVVGLMVTPASMIVMWILALAKRRPTRLPPWA
jgi:hypothetical protein